MELAANDESQHSLLLASGVVEALEYGIMHDFSVWDNLYLRTLPVRLWRLSASGKGEGH